MDRKRPIILKDTYFNGKFVHKQIEKLLKKEFIKNIRQNVKNLFKNTDFIKLLDGDYYSELPYLKIEDDNYKIRRIDFISFYNDDVYIVDFKSDNNFDELYFKNQYFDQIIEYKNDISEYLTNKNITFNKIHCYIYSLKLEKMIKID